MIWRTFFLCFIISFGQFVGAYESVIIGTTLQKPDFMRHMGLWDGKGKETSKYGSLEGAIVGLFQVDISTTPYASLHSETNRGNLDRLALSLARSLFR